MTDSMEFDVIIVGGGPSGLSCAIRLQQLARETGRELSVCLLEKGSEIGAHILSGAVLEPRALNELFPDWQTMDAPVKLKVSEDRFLYMTEDKARRLPTPPTMHNYENYLISLGNLCRWLAQQAEGLGVQIFAGFAARELIFDDAGKVAGVRSGEFGRGKDGQEKAEYQPPMELRATYTLLGEGCRGSLTRGLEERFELRKDSGPQTYGIGLKELWDIPAENHQPGLVEHSVGWPLDTATYGGSFLYHQENHQVAIGMVIGLDYQNPYLNPFKEFQRFKTHPAVRKHLEGGKRVSYGARSLTEGGYQAIPQLVFPGGALMGCAAGFMNVPKIKGTHTAMKSGMVLAETVFDAIAEKKDLQAYPEKLKASWVYDELYRVRNIRPAFRKGLWAGLAYAALDTYLLRGKAPWTFKHHADHTALKPASACQPIEYPKPDGKVSFDILSSVFLSSTNHEEDQPVHLTLKDASVPIAVNLKEYDAPEQRYCPAGVYEIVEENNQPRLQIN
ncbi:MAG: 4Fe-4S dicluster domain-containing protein, partial [Rickettsiales bacterium]|nr:4Fe-4S dicluster domain-containing protein [Rickettsiales bacterium]